MSRARRLLATLWLAIALAAVALMPAFHVAAVVQGFGEGCTPGFWKNHPAHWDATPYRPGQTLATVFSFPANHELADDTLMEALNYPGGSGVVGAQRILLRHAVAGILNAAYPDMEYPLTRFTIANPPTNVAPIVPRVNELLASNNRSAILAYAGTLDFWNNDGECPLPGGPSYR